MASSGSKACERVSSEEVVQPRKSARGDTRKGTRWLLKYSRLKPPKGVLLTVTSIQRTEGPGDARPPENCGHVTDPPHPDPWNQKSESLEIYYVTYLPLRSWMINSTFYKLQNLVAQVHDSILNERTNNVPSQNAYFIDRTEGGRINATKRNVLSFLPYKIRKIEKAEPYANQATIHRCRWFNSYRISILRVFPISCSTHLFLRRGNTRQPCIDVSRRGYETI